MNHFLVLIALVNCMEFGNIVKLSQRQIADTLRLQESSTSTLISVLEDLDFLTRNQGTIQEFTLMVNPEFFLKGQKDTWHKVQEDYEALRRSRLESKQIKRSERPVEKAGTLEA